MEEEIWKDIEGYEYLYQVSNFGNVRSLNYRHTGKICLLKQVTEHYGYKSVTLSKNNKKKRYFVHRLVVETFLCKIPEGMVINHKNEDKSNNEVNNLEICTQLYNINHGTRNERMIKTRKEKCTCNAEKPIYAIKNEEKIWFKSRCECARQLNLYPGNIGSCLIGKIKTYHGYTFEYAPIPGDK